MQSYTIPKVKICCISSTAEAASAIAFGASAVGLVGHMPSGPGVIDDATIATIAATVPPSIASFLLTSRTNGVEIIDHHKQTQTTTIQLVDAISTETYGLLRQTLPSVKLVQVIHVLNESSVEEALQVAMHVDALLLDSGNPHLAIKQLGGTGRTHNWVFSKQIREQSPVPVFLAGGLHADNVQKAIETVEPYGIDLCTGVRTHGKLDTQKLEQFFNVIHKM